MHLVIITLFGLMFVVFAVGVFLLWAIVATFRMVAGLFFRRPQPRAMVLPPVPQPAPGSSLPWSQSPMSAAARAGQRCGGANCCAVNPPGAKYCRRCGRSVAAPAPAAAAAGPILRLAV